MASRDYTYCTRECEEMDCKHNKKHLDNMDVVTAISWYNYPECEKGNVAVMTQYDTVGGRE